MDIAKLWSSTVRKWRKLRRDPKAFLRDLKLPGMRKRLGEVSRIAPVLAPRLLPATRDGLLATIQSRWGDVDVQLHTVDVAETDLASVFFLPSTDPTHPAHRLFEQAAANPEFVGFRRRYLFKCAYDLDDRFRHPDDLERLLRSSPRWHRRITAGMRNAVFVNPNDVLPFLVRGTDHEVRLIVCLTSAHASSSVLERFAASVDVLIATRDVESPNGRPRRFVSVDSDDAIVTALRTVIIDNKKKELNALIPVYGDVPYLERIDELNASPIDGVIGMSGYETPRGETFADLLDRIVDRTNFVLLREEQFLRYKDLCDEGRIADLLRTSLEDGCRYDVIL